MLPAFRVFPEGLNTMMDTLNGASRARPSGDRLRTALPGESSPLMSSLVQSQYCVEVLHHGEKRVKLPFKIGLAVLANALEYLHIESLMVPNTRSPKLREIESNFLGVALGTRLPHDSLLDKL
jgi:hypothetical protein